jgi:solute carrier family 35 protein F1/2
MDVEGNFFTVLAYRYTTILSAQLIEFWAIVVVIIISFIFLHVRYHITQYIGVIVCIGMSASCSGLSSLSFISTSNANFLF